MYQLVRNSMLLILILAPVATFAAMYKWVDKDGVTQYTQEPPPPGVQGEEIKPPPPVNTEGAEKELKKLEEGLDSRDEQRQNDAKKAADEQGLAAEKKQKCEQARQRLEKAERPRTNFVDPDGTERRATEEERQEQVADSQKQVREFCE